MPCILSTYYVRNRYEPVVKNVENSSTPEWRQFSSFSEYFKIDHENVGGWLVLHWFDTLIDHILNQYKESTMGSVANESNPGTVMASAVDAEIATFRTMQESMQQYQSNLQLVQSQRTENEMVLEEFQLLMEAKKKKTDGKAVVNVYKMIGPVLMSQSVDEAYQTVEKRIQFITTEQNKIQNQMDEQEKLLQEQAKKVQQMQSMLQQSTVQAVQAIAQQHQAA